MKKYIFKGSKESRILVIDNEKYIYIKIENQKISDSNISDFKEVRMKELESMKIKMFVDDLDMELKFKSEVSGFLKQIENIPNSIH